MKKVLGGQLATAETGNLADSKREAEKLILSKASAYTTAVKRKSHQLMQQILDQGGDACKREESVDGAHRKRDKKVKAKNGVGANRGSSFAVSPVHQNKR